MKKGLIIVFEDEDYNRFYPLTLSRPIFHLLVGAKTNIQRIEHFFRDSTVVSICRSPQLGSVFGCASRDDVYQLVDNGIGKIMLINGSVVLTSENSGFVEELKGLDDFTAFERDNKLIASVIPTDKLSSIADVIFHLYEEGQSRRFIEESPKTRKVEIRKLSYIWDTILSSSELIAIDFNDYYKSKADNSIVGDSYTYTSGGVYFSESVRADACSVIDSRNGPVIMEAGVKISPFCYLEGPAFIGRNSHLVGGKITGGCSLGEGCRVGGEVENTIMIANSNKYHEGFLGHSYIGEWVNLGALTTNSDLKNNYSPINIKQNGKIEKTGEIKVGCFIGDHSKTGIGMTLNTGTIIGFSSNLFGGNLILEKEIPSFAWGNDSLRREYSLSKAMETADIVLKRREHQFTNEHRLLFEHIHKETKELRDSWLQGKKH